MNNTKRIIDVAMIASMYLSMSLHLFGSNIHKCMGLITFILYLIHNILNRKWYKTLFKGEYNKQRLIHTITNLVVLLALIGIMATGVLLSREVATGFGDMMTVGRILHNTFSYIGCMGIAVHIGFHLKRRKYHDD